MKKEKAPNTAYNISKRIALATQLSIIPPYSSEHFKLSNYGLGGHYNIHIDADNGFSNAGNNIV